MFRFILISLVLLFASPANADTESDIRAVLDYFVEVWNEDDVAALDGYYHADFVLINDKGTVGRTQLLQDLSLIGRNGGDRGTLKQSGVSITPLGDDHAVAYGLSTLSFDDGSSLQSWFTTVYVKTPFGWKALLTRG